MSKAQVQLLICLVAISLTSSIPHQKRQRDDRKKCDYCSYYEKTGLSPYELLWTVGSEISPVLYEDERSALLMNPEDLQEAEKYFDSYCSDYCQRDERRSDIAPEEVEDEEE